MKVVVLGTGMQGKAALYDLAGGEQVESILAADQDLADLEHYVNAQGLADRVDCRGLDANDPADLRRVIAGSPDVVIDLLPVRYNEAVAAAAVERGVHVVNASYRTPALSRLAGQAQALGVAILPEFGLDPGIDLVLLGRALRGFDKVEEILSYGSGIPEPAAATNPIQYKISWTFEGVLRSYHREARLIREGQEVTIPPGEIFDPEQLHTLNIDGLGDLEAYPNGDAVQYVDRLGLARADIRLAGRYTLRWPGHAAFWRVMSGLGLLDDEPVMVDGLPIDRRRFLAAALEPRLQYAEDERDLVIVRVEVAGQVAGRSHRVGFQVIDRRDPDTGLSAMSRTVGFTASIGAQMLGSGLIQGRGLLSPLDDVPFRSFVRELASRGIEVTNWESE